MAEVHAKEYVGELELIEPRTRMLYGYRERRQRRRRRFWRRIMGILAVFVVLCILAAL